MPRAAAYPHPVARPHPLRRGLFRDGKRGIVRSALQCAPVPL